jgi:hypothetical protein
MPPKKRRAPKSPAATGAAKANEEPIKPSPFTKKRALFSVRPESATKKEAVGITATIRHVLPTITDGDEDVVGQEGFFIHLSGYGSRAASRPIYERNVTANQVFLAATQPVGRAFDLNLDGEPVMIPALSGRFYRVQVLVHLLDGDDPATKEELVQFFNETFVPAYMRLPDVRPSSRPTLSVEEPYVIHRAWSQVLGDGDQLDDLFQFGIRPETETESLTLQSWACESKENLYSLWTPGEIPDDKITAWALTNEHLLPDDIPQPPNQNQVNVDNLNLEAELESDDDNSN